MHHLSTEIHTATSGKSFLEQIESFGGITHLLHCVVVFKPWLTKSNVCEKSRSTSERKTKCSNKLLALSSKQESQKKTPQTLICDLSAKNVQTFGPDSWLQNAWIANFVQFGAVIGNQANATHQVFGFSSSSAPLVTSVNLDLFPTQTVCLTQRIIMIQYCQFVMWEKLFGPF